MSSRPVEPQDPSSLAYENHDFLNSADGRSLRILAEYQEPMARFRRERIEDTVVFFGSARVRLTDDAEAPLSTPLAAALDTSHYYEEARTLAGMLAVWAKSLPGPRHRFVVTSGGGPGIMEAANRGAFEAGCKTIGLNIRLPFEQHANRFLTPELDFTFHYFFMRKFWFAYLAKALVIFPGGFGTMDEMFEILTLAQTEKLSSRITVVIYGSEYWKGVLNLDAMAARGMIAEKDKDLFRFADSPQEAFDILQESLLATYLAPRTSTPDLPADSIPEAPAPCAQDVLGPDIARTRT